MAKYVHDKRRSGRKVLPLLFLLVAVLVGGLVWGTSAKYKQERTDSQNVVVAKEFFFSSDLLTKELTTYNLNPGKNSVTFKLCNFEGGNVSNMEVPYTLTVTPNATVSYDGGSEELPADIATTHTVTLSELQPGTTYTVTAVGSNQYVRTLQAAFVVGASDAGVFQSVSETDDYIDLTLWTHNSSGAVTITFPDGLIPDSTDDALSSIHNYNNGVYNGDTVTLSTMGVFSSHVYRFFKSTEEYTGGNITASVGGIQAAPATVN